MAAPGSYTQVDWQNKAAGGTKLSAENLNIMEEGIAALFNFAAKGSLWVASAAATVAELAIGTNGFVLMADSAQAGGMKWALSPETDLVQAKGDLLAGTAADTLARLAVGTDGQVLTAASGQTAGMNWATPASAPVFANYTPTWTQNSSNPTLGNGTLTGRYTQAGNLVVGRISLVIGSTTSVGTGAFFFSLPATAGGITLGPVGTTHALDTGTSEFVGVARLQTTTTVAVFTGATPGVAWDENSPIATPATGDQYNVEFVYEAA